MKRTKPGECGNMAGVSLCLVQAHVPDENSTGLLQGSGAMISRAGHLHKHFTQN